MTTIELDHACQVIREQLSSAVLGDVLDTMGHRRQFLPQAIRPLTPDAKLVGRAMPVLECDVFDDEQPFGLMFEALDSLQAGEVYLATGGSGAYAMWGELMTTAALTRGAAGTVLNGFLRDTARVVASGLPVFARGSYAQDQRGRGRVIAYRVPVEIEGVQIKPGDLMVGDIDGLLVIPLAAVGEAIERALEKNRQEGQVGALLQQGAASNDLFKRFGVM